MSNWQKFSSYLKRLNQKVPNDRLERWRTKSAIAASIVTAIKGLIELFHK